MRYIVISNWASGVLLAATLAVGAAALRGWKRGLRFQSPVRRARTGTAAEREATLAKTAFTAGRLGDSATHWIAEAAAAERDRNPEGAATALLRAAAVLKEQRRWDDAVTTIEKALAIADARLDTELDERARYAKVEVLVAAERAPEAIAEARTAARNARSRAGGEDAEQRVLELLLNASAQLPPDQQRTDAAQLRDDLARLRDLSSRQHGTGSRTVLPALSALQNLCQLVGDNCAAMEYGRDRLTPSLWRLGR